jgi:hypothetical protein
MSPKEAIIQSIRRWRRYANVRVASALLNRLSAARLPELLVFIQNLRETTVAEQWSGALMSESSLGKDWLLPEEDKAWRDL